MPPKSIRPIWEVLGSDHDTTTAGGIGSVQFRSEQFPGLTFTVTLDDSGRVVSFQAWRFAGSPNPTWLGTRLLRSVQLDTLASLALVELRDRYDRGATNERFWQGEPVRHQQAFATARALNAPAPRRPGRRGHSIEHYAELAVDYENWRSGGEALVKLADRRGVSASALRAQLHTARRKGLLTSTQRGVAGGIATDEARRLVNRSVLAQLASHSQPLQPRAR